VVSAWPPPWASSYGAGSKFAVGEQGILRDVARRADHLMVTMEYDAREHVGALQWDAPPSLEDVEKVLRANVGKEIKTVSEVEV